MSWSEYLGLLITIVSPINHMVLFILFSVDLFFLFICFIICLANDENMTEVNIFPASDAFNALIFT